MRKILPYIFLIALFSCKKYEEGPTLSLRTKKQRLCHTWQYLSYFENGVDKTETQLNFYQNFILGIGKDGSYSLDYVALGQVPNNETGIWEFDAKKEKIIFTRQFPSGNPYEWKIIKLKKRELWVEQTDTINNVLRFHKFVSR